MWIMNTGKSTYFTCVTVCADDDDSRSQSAETDIIYFFISSRQIYFTYFI